MLPPGLLSRLSFYTPGPPAEGCHCLQLAVLIHINHQSRKYITGLPTRESDGDIFFFNELPLFQITLLYVVDNVWHGHVPLSWEQANFQQLKKILQPCKVTAKASVPRHWDCPYIFINNQKGSTGPVSCFFFFSLVCDKLPIPYPRVSTRIVDECVCPLYSLALLIFLSLLVLWPGVVVNFSSIFFPLQVLGMYVYTTMLTLTICLVAF